MSNIPQESVESHLPNSLPVQSEEAQLESPNQKEALPSSLEFINKINENENENPAQPCSQPIQNPNTINNIGNINAQEENNNNINEIKSEPISHEPKKTKLENKFSFWYRIDDNIQYQLQKQALDKKEYETQVKKIAEFDTIEDFWGIFQHLRKPDSCRAGIEYFMFKEPIKPMWEDEYNKNGGRISIKLRKDYTTIIWEEMIFILIGGILPKDIKEEINGIVVTSRKDFNTLQIWFKNYNDLTGDLEQCIRDILVIPPEVNLEIKQFNKSNNKKEYNNSNKKSGGYYNNKGYNNYYGDNEYDYYSNKDKNEHKKNKHQNHKNK